MTVVDSILFLYFCILLYFARYTQLEFDFYNKKNISLDLTVNTILTQHHRACRMIIIIISQQRLLIMTK